MNTQINPVNIFPKGEATQIFIRTSTEGIYEPTGTIFWQMLDAKGQVLSDGNIHLTVEEVAEWGDTMDYIENLVLERLNLTKLAETLI